MPSKAPRSLIKLNKLHQDPHQNSSSNLLPGLGSFSHLPRELRDIIYTDLISSGSISITAASKTTNTETAAILPKQGVFRTSLGFHHDQPTPSRTIIYPRTSERIQNVEIRVNSSSGTSGRFAASLNELKNVFGASIPRRRCRVELELDCDTRMLYFDILLEGFLGDFKSFRGFAEVVVLVATEPSDGTPLEDWERGKLLAKQRRAMHAVEMALVPAFGDVVWREEERGMAACFHPQVM